MKQLCWPLIAVTILSSCQTTKYDWGSYEDVLYQTLAKDKEPQKQIQRLLNASSYPTLRTLLERHGEHALRTEILSMRIVYDDRDRRRRIEFSLV